MRRRLANDDDSLLQAVAYGDSIALSKLMKRHRQWVTRLLFAFTHNTEEAEDLTQEVFTRLYRHAQNYRARGNFTSWLRRIVVNCGSSYLQKREPPALVPMAILEETPTDFDTDPLVTVLKESLQSEIHEAITTLPDDQRDALLLRCFLGLTVPEIARRQNCPEGTVKSRLSNGLRRVRKLLEDEQESEE